MFDWKNYLKIANDFLLIPQSSPDAEAYYRCGISRAYYSVYHMAENFIQSKNISINQQPNEGPHQATIRTLSSLNQNASNSLSRLKDHRTNSDYNSNANVTEKKLGISLMLAASIEQQLNS